MAKNQFALEDLFSLIKKKISKKEKNSYTYELAKNGLELINRKVGEEAIEVIIAAYSHEKKSNKKTRQDLIGEVCDLYYHSMVLLASQGIELDEILQELNKRNK